MTSEEPTTAPLTRWWRGTHRVTHPEDTLEHVAPLASRCGITRLARVTHLDRVGIPVAVAYRPMSRSIVVSQGKGLDDTAAKVSALMEGIELWHAEYAEHETPEVKADELEGEVITPSQLPATAGTAYRPEARIPWIEGRDVASGDRVWVPFEAVTCDWRVPRPSWAGCVAANTNGLASGNVMDEAVAHGLFELVERDAVTLWELLDPQDRVATRIDPATLDDDCAAMVERAQSAGLLVGLWDVTSDVGIASVLCGVLAPGEPRPFPAAGSGTHPDRRVAALRAITEAAQSRLTLRMGIGDDRTRAGYEISASGVAGAKALLDEPASRPFSELPTFEGASPADDVSWGVARLGDVGIATVVVVDLSKEDLAIPVARVLAPGLEGLSRQPGWTPGPRARARVAAGGRGAP